MDTIKDRLKIFIKGQGLTVQQFEKKCGFSNAYVNSIGRMPGVDKLEAIIREYPNLNREWLLSGEGKMLNSEIPMIQIGNHGIQQQGFAGNDMKQAIRTDGAFKEFISGLENQNELIKQAMAQTDKALNEMAEQRKQMDRLITMIENLQSKQ